MGRTRTIAREMDTGLMLMAVADANLLSRRGIGAEIAQG